MAYDAMGRFEDAVAALDGPEFRTSPWSGLAYARTGRREDAMRLAAGTSSSNALPLSLIYFTHVEPERDRIEDAVSGYEEPGAASKSGYECVDGTLGTAGVVAAALREGDAASTLS
jgi:hypothetical protein